MNRTSKRLPFLAAERGVKSNVAANSRELLGRKRSTEEKRSANDPPISKKKPTVPGVRRKKSVIRGEKRAIIPIKNENSPSSTNFYKKIVKKAK